LGRGWRSNQRIHVGYGLGSEENDAKLKEEFLQIIFRLFFPRGFCYAAA
jgi:hypothetical protein